MLKKKLTKRSIGFAILIASSVGILPSCYRVPKEIEPKINYAIQDRYLKSLPAPFSELTATEEQSPWGTEYLIGLGFARSLDLYRAITAFRRAEILAPKEEVERKLEMQYEILLCYYLGRRYSEVTKAFDVSALSKVTTEFPAFHDLLVVLYDSYQQLDQDERACQILELIRQHYPSTYSTLSVSSALQRADFCELNEIANNLPERPYINSLLNSYRTQKKSPTTASVLNAVLPGSGYLYLGQRQTAFTALVFNGLFIASSVYFFKNGPVSAGIITASFEAGWYFGGIYGAGTQAKLYNERLYERTVNPIMNKEGLFPVFRLQYAF